MRIRPEIAADRPAALAVIEAAFARPHGGRPVEATLLEQLWDSTAFLPELALVAEDDDGVVCGHVITTRARIGSAQSLGLGPIGVLPAHQGRGIGGALVEESVRRAAKLGESAVVLLGDPLFYGRFRFARADELGVIPPEPRWQEHFLIRPLAGTVPTGPFRYASPFEAL
ncbi:GNAT family N-acetyltransferase [Arthrobacter sp. JZ12]|uniref:GNAT family N-acetyltransferase n=1 Tax=Arthrobacter sp. JZ12 TaxID=2654190 RepID=UPI002B4AA2EE|nr:N-acetyltransferase [Arthrobacter sp. JZ12]WRH24354.1 GNAT family N-acetyltransferase [Arthrobacter sp. JZ12]